MQRLRTVYFEFPYTETDTEPRLLITPTSTIELNGQIYRVLERRRPNGEIESLYVPGAIKTTRTRANRTGTSEVHAEECLEVGSSNEGLALYRKIRDRYPGLRISQFEIDGYKIPEGIDGVDFMKPIPMDIAFSSLEDPSERSGLLSRMKEKLFG